MLQGKCPPFCFVLSHNNNNNLGLQIWSITSLSPVQKKQSHHRNVYNLCKRHLSCREDIFWESYHYALILRTYSAEYLHIILLQFWNLFKLAFPASPHPVIHEGVPAQQPIYKMSYLADVSTSAIVNDLQITDNICNSQDNFIMLKLTTYSSLFCLSEIRIYKNTLIL